ncbi:hypothetical protein [Polyangium spumosum]|uniref:Uncharacterized protein n=1 Tax=Polyangium spumosum TaxID=889282 RepID=A0A6N7PI27_9BACT|nr:hypothetical protein [Polyangium spumosum]MRG91659.1 hypothetical protein [Polyangium spumosum]
MSDRIVSSGFTHASCKLALRAAIQVLEQRLKDDDADQMTAKEIKLLQEVVDKVKSEKQAKPAM